MTLILTVGLPRSGKSTWSREYVQAHPGAAIVNPDSIRLALHGQLHLPSAEPMVWSIARYMVKALFLAGHHTVILDATNVRAAHRRQWKSTDWTTVVHVVPTDEKTCRARALDGGDVELAFAIDRMLIDLKDPDNYTELWRDYEWV